MVLRLQYVLCHLFTIIGCTPHPFPRHAFLLHRNWICFVAFRLNILCSCFRAVAFVNHVMTQTKQNEPLHIFCILHLIGVHTNPCAYSQNRFHSSLVWQAKEAKNKSIPNSLLIASIPQRSALAWSHITAWHFGHGSYSFLLRFVHCIRQWVNRISFNIRTTPTRMCEMHSNIYY